METLNECQRVAAKLLVKRGWVDARQKAGIDHAKPWGDVRSKEKLLAALPLIPAYDPPDSEG